MINAIIFMFLNGSIAEQQYISKLACDVDVAAYSYEFSQDANFSLVYSDGSSIDIIKHTDNQIVKNADGHIVYSKQGE